MDDKDTNSENIKIKGNDNHDVDNHDVDQDLNQPITEEIILNILADKERHLDPLSLQADLDKAKHHFKASQFYPKKYFEKQEGIIFFKLTSSDILFCDDCLNPIPQEENAPKLPYCTDTKELAELGTGVFLYFFFMKFVFFMCFIMFGIVSISEIYVTRKYNHEMEYYCNVIRYNYTNNTYDICTAWNKTDNDWLYSMNFDNISKIKLIIISLEIYKSLLSNNTALLPFDRVFNINFMNFLCMCVLFVVNCIFIVIVRNLDIEADFKVITPEDFTLMISDIPIEFDSNKKLKDEVLVVNDISPIEVNITYKMSDYMQIKNDFILNKKKLRSMHMKNVRILFIFIFSKRK